MIEFANHERHYETLVTRGRYSGRIYYCTRPFDLGEAHYYLGSDLKDWQYFGGAPALPDSILRDYILEIVEERKALLENYVRQNQDLNLIIYDPGDGTWQIMQRADPSSFNLP